LEQEQTARITTLENEMKELSNAHEVLVHLFEADPQGRNKLKLLYSEAEKNRARVPGQMLFLPKSEYTPDSFSYRHYDADVQDQENKNRE
jgi:hypothetical protein